MNKSRQVPRFGFFTFLTFALIGFFISANLVDTSWMRALAPIAVAKTLMAPEYIPADIPSSGDRELDLIILRAGERHGVDPRLIHAVIWQESKYKARSASHRGAQGLMQLMPATARRFDCHNMSDKSSNVQAGTRYLRYLLQRFNGDVVLALAGFNAGEGSVNKYDGVPPYGETQNYVRIIASRYGKMHHPLLPPEEARAEFRLLPVVARLGR